MDCDGRIAVGGMPNVLSDMSTSPRFDGKGAKERIELSLGNPWPTVSVNVDEIGRAHV